MRSICASKRSLDALRLENTPTCLHLLQENSLIEMSPPSLPAGLAREAGSRNVPERFALTQLRDPDNPIRAKFGVLLPESAERVAASAARPCARRARSDSGSRSRLRCDPKWAQRCSECAARALPNRKHGRPCARGANAAPTPGGWQLCWRSNAVVQFAKELFRVPLAACRRAGLFLPRCNRAERERRFAKKFADVPASRVFPRRQRFVPAARSGGLFHACAD